MKLSIKFGTVIFIFLFGQAIAAQPTAFNYQGRLTDGGAAATAPSRMLSCLKTALGFGNFKYIR